MLLLIIRYKANARVNDAGSVGECLHWQSLDNTWRATNLFSLTVDHQHIIFIVPDPKCTEDKE